MTVENLGGPPPVIVFIAQLGTDGESWRPVLDHLHGLPTFTYDRPGTGKAPPRPAPNPPLPYGVFAAELDELLEQHRVQAPLVLVGHSFGSLIARAYAAAHPGKVAGLVHVDGSIPQFHLIPTGDPKFDGGTEIDVVAGQLEILSMDLPRVPTLVLTRTPGRWSGSEGPPHPRVEDLWLVSQQILARESAAPLIVAYSSSHQMPAEVPELVAYAVSEVHDAVFRQSTVALDPAILAGLGGRRDN